MQLRKNWFSRIIWIILTILSITMIALNVITGVSELGFTDRNTLIGFVCLFGVVCFLIYEFISGVTRGIFSTSFFNAKRTNRITVILFMVAFVFFSAFHFRQLALTDFLLNKNDLIYFYALDRTIPFPNNMSYLKILYVLLMRLVFALFGSGQMVAVLVQYVIEQLSVVLLYFVAKKLSNGPVAIVFFVVVHFISCFELVKMNLSEEKLLVFLVIALIYLFLWVFDYESKNKNSHLLVEFLYIGLGILCGCMAVLEAVGIVLLLAFFVVLMTETSFFHSAQDKRLRYMPLHATYLLAGAVSVFAFLMYLFKDASSGFVGQLQKYAEMYFYRMSYSADWIYQPEELALNIIFAVIALIWFFTYFVVPYDYVRLGVLVGVGIYVLQSFGIQSVTYDQLAIVSRVLICAGSIQSILYYQRLKLQPIQNRMAVYQEVETEAETESEMSADTEVEMSADTKVEMENYEPETTESKVDEVQITESEAGEINNCESQVAESKAGESENHELQVAESKAGESENHESQVAESIDNEVQSEQIPENAFEIERVQSEQIPENAFEIERVQSEQIPENAFEIERVQEEQTPESDMELEETQDASETSVDTGSSSLVMEEQEKCEENNHDEIEKAVLNELLNELEKADRENELVDFSPETPVSVADIREIPGKIEAEMSSFEPIVDSFTTVRDIEAQFQKTQLEVDETLETQANPKVYFETGLEEQSRDLEEALRGFCHETIDLKELEEEMEEMEKEEIEKEDIEKEETETMNNPVNIPMDENLFEQMDIEKELKTQMSNLVDAIETFDEKEFEGKDEHTVSFENEEKAEILEKEVRKFIPIEEPIKQPIKKKRPKIDYAINDDFGDYDITDIPEDDDFDI